MRFNLTLGLILLTSNTVALLGRPDNSLYVYISSAGMALGCVLIGNAVDKIVKELKK